MQKEASNTTLVNIDPDIIVTFNDFFSRLIGVDGNSFSNECKIIIEKGDVESLISKYLESIDAIFSLDDEKDVESCIQAIVSMIYSAKNGSDADSVIKLFVDKIASNESSKHKLRLKSLISLLNLSSTNKSKFYSLSGTQYSNFLFVMLL